MEAAVVVMVMAGIDGLVVTVIVTVAVTTVIIH